VGRRRRQYPALRHVRSAHWYSKRQDDEKRFGQHRQCLHVLNFECGLQTAMAIIQQLCRQKSLYMFLATPIPRLITPKSSLHRPANIMKAEKFIFWTIGGLLSVAVGPLRRF